MTSEILEVVTGGPIEAIRPNRGTAQFGISSDAATHIENESRAIDLTMRALVRQVFVTNQAQRVRTILFIGIDEGAGCSSIAAAAAALLAKEGTSVCFIGTTSPSTSTRKPANNFGGCGLLDALEHKEEVGRCMQTTEWEGLSFLPFGSLETCLPAPLAPDRLQSMMTSLRSEYEYVVVDAPPPESYDALIFASLVDGVVLVLEAERTRRDAAAAAAKRLRATGANIVGAVLNKRSFPIPKPIYDRL